MKSLRPTIGEAKANAEHWLVAWVAIIALLTITALLEKFSL